MKESVRANLNLHKYVISRRISLSDQQRFNLLPLAIALFRFNSIFNEFSPIPEFYFSLWTTTWFHCKIPLVTIPASEAQGTNWSSDPSRCARCPRRSAFPRNQNVKGTHEDVGDLVSSIYDGPRRKGGKLGYPGRNVVLATAFRATHASVG